MYFDQYLQCSKDRKTYLSSCEEEELIRRLYTCPKVNLYPPRLYEDLPPLKFWSSPASTIENYLRRKVFHKRLQLAYEFNQTKEPNLPINEVEQSHESRTSEQLSNAMKQLADDRDYFENFCKLDHLLSHLTNRPGENKSMWEQFKSLSTTASIIDDIILETENKPEDEYKSEIRKRYFDYREFYKLQNLTQDSQPPLAVTIGLPVTGTQSDIDFGKKQSVSFYEIGTNISSDVLPHHENLPMETASEKSLKNLPKVAQSSLTTLIHEDPHWRHHLTQTMKEITGIRGCGEDELPKLYIYEGSEKTPIRRGTLLNVRDSVEVTHEKLSRVNRSLVPNLQKSQVSCMSLASHKDSLSVLMNKMLEKNSLRISQPQQKETRQRVNQTSSSEELMFSHEDSIQLAVDRMQGSKVNSSLSCFCHDIQDRKSIQFICQYHANMNDAKLNAVPPATNRYLSILSKTTFVSAKDSLVVAHKTLTTKGRRRYSVGCQVEEIGIPGNETLYKKDVLNIQTRIKKSMKQKVEELKEDNSEIKSTPSKLRNYLMQSICINQVVPDKDGKKIL